MANQRRGIAGNRLKAVFAVILVGVAAIAIVYRPPADPESLAAEARAAVLAHDYEKALQLAEDALTMVKNGGYPDAYIAKFHLLRGQAWQLVGELQFALDDYTRAVELAPSYPEAYFLRGAYFAALQQVDLALSDFATTVALDPGGRFGDEARGYVERLSAAADGQ
ncbi:MAG: hypothetical protein AELANPGJ_01884 [Anaerolineae bacterium]|nr:MAG: lipoprotein NlpI [Chloroflexi bacterium OLB13]MBV6436620.1 hypothetical protein [Anaerolineae bacterium]